MLSGIIGAIVVAWFCNLFGASDIILELIQPIFSSVHLTTAHYYALAGLVGFIAGAISDNS